MFLNDWMGRIPLGPMLSRLPEAEMRNELRELASKFLRPVLLRRAVGSYLCISKVRSTRPLRMTCGDSGRLGLFGSIGRPSYGRGSDHIDLTAPHPHLPLARRPDGR